MPQVRKRREAVHHAREGILIVVDLILLFVIGFLIGKRTARVDYERRLARIQRMVDEYGQFVEKHFKKPTHKGGKWTRSRRG